MADLRDEQGNQMYLTDEHGKPAQLVDEYGNALQLTGVATTVPHLKESSYTGPHPITAPITTTNTPHHAQPISVSHSHNPLEHHDLRWFGNSSSNSTEENCEGAGRKNDPMDETKSKPTATVTGGSRSESVNHEKKSYI